MHKTIACKSTKTIARVWLLAYKSLFLYSFFIVAISTSLKAAITDSVLNGLWIETKIQYGAIYPHHSEIEYIIGNNIVGADITISTESRNRHLWEELYRYPRYGLGYSFINLGNPEILGNLHGLYGFIDIPFYTPKSKFSFNYQVNLGLGYFTNTYDPYKNPLNHIISSQYNVYIGLDFVGRIKISEKNELKTSFELTHCSNGKTRSPNLGVNAFTLSAAWLYSLKPATTLEKHIENREYKKHYIEIISNFGGRRDDNMKDKVFLVSSLITDYQYALTPKYAIGLGIDAFYDASLGQKGAYDIPEVSDSYSKNQIGAHFGVRIRYNRLNIIMNAGHYIFYDYLRQGKIYSRLGLRYSLTESVLLNFTIKAHSTIADFIEWGIGYRIKTKGK